MNPRQHDLSATPWRGTPLSSRLLDTPGGCQNPTRCSKTTIMASGKLIFTEKFEHL